MSASQALKDLQTRRDTDLRQLVFTKRWAVRVVVDNSLLHLMTNEPQDVVLLHGMVQPK
jgi:hypothetical protein